MHSQKAKCDHLHVVSPFVYITRWQHLPKCGQHRWSLKLTASLRVSQHHRTPRIQPLILPRDMAAGGGCLNQTLQHHRTFHSSPYWKPTLLLLYPLPGQHIEWSGQQELGLRPELLAATLTVSSRQKTDAVSVHMGSSNDNSLWLRARESGGAGRQAKLPFSFQKWQWNKWQEIHSADQHRKQCQGTALEVEGKPEER